MKCLSVIVAFVLLGAVSSRAASVTFEAESGTLGTNFLVGTDGTTQYISNTNNNTGNNPGIPGRVASYSVTFPEAGTYDLYARVRVGPMWANDDSFLYGNGFGTKSPTNDADWILCNNLWNVGFTNTSDIVTGSGTALTNVWKWINVSEFNGGETPITFTVTAGNLTQTFQIGGREDGFQMDKFVFGTSNYTFTVADLDAGGPGTPPASPPPPKPSDIVNGNLIQFNNNGTWCWFQSERAVVDINGGKIVVGSDASGAGTGGSPREGDVEASIFDLQSGASQTYTLKDGASDPSAFYADDHNSPGLLVMPNGRYLAIYAGHNTEKYSYWRIFDGTNWSSEQTYDWNTQPGGADFNTTYSNPHYMAADGRIYNFSRGAYHGSPNLITSDDLGQTWTYRGILVTNQNVGYVNGYFNYCGNGVDRIDFVCTEYHPADYNTSIYHGYVSNAMSFKSDGTLVDSVLYDKLAPTTPNFTRVFAANTVMPPGQTNTRCWNIDVKRYDDGTVATLFQARVNDNSTNPEHAFFYARWDGRTWTSTYLGKAGTRLYVSQDDYTGLGALCLNDPNTIFISTPIDPRNQTNLTVHEIFKGVTTNNGATWSWTPITQKSVRDNLRPIVPAWDRQNQVLLWWRGTYTAAQNFDTAVVGILQHRSEVVGPMTYVDATTTTTFFAATGAPLVTGSGSGQWHERTGSGNGGSVLASADVSAENAPALRTTVTVTGPGTYDVWVNFWANPATTADWRIMGGLATNRMRIFRQMASKEVQAGDHTASLVLTNTDTITNYLYQAYVGRVVASSSNTLDVFVDDNAIQAGTTNTLVGDTCRTWYDGMSYAKVERFRITGVAYNAGGSSATITWNSTPPELSLTTPTYTVWKKNFLTDPTWSIVATGVPSGGAITSCVDTSAGGSVAFYRVSMP